MLLLVVLLLAVAVLCGGRLLAVTLLSGWRREILLVCRRRHGAIGRRVIGRVAGCLRLAGVAVLSEAGGGAWWLESLVVVGRANTVLVLGCGRRAGRWVVHRLLLRPIRRLRLQWWRAMGGRGVAG